MRSNLPLPWVPVVAVVGMTDLLAAVMLAGVMEEQEEALPVWSTGSKLMVH